MDKKKAIVDVQNSLLEEIKSMDNSIEMLEEFRDDSPGAMQSRHDTSQIESQWGILDMKKRKAKLLKDIEALKSFAVKENYSSAEEGAVVDLNIKNERKSFFLLPVAGGVSLTLDDKVVLTITKEAPLGKLIFGKKLGEYSDGRLRATIISIS